MKADDSTYVSPEVEIDWEEHKKESNRICNEVYERLPDDVKAADKWLMRRTSRYLGIPDDEPPTQKQFRELRWFKERGVMNDKEEGLIRKVLKENHNERGWTRALDFLAKLQHNRMGSY